MKALYLRATTTAEVWTCLARLRAKTVVFDVEPLVAFWDTGQDTLHDGIATVLDSILDSGPDTVVFATNSARKLPTRRRQPGPGQLTGIGGKPVRVATYRHLPRPGIVIGDQVATDGVLASRLGYTFVHYTPGLATVPLGPRLMRQIGRPIRALLFRSA